MRILKVLHPALFAIVFLSCDPPPPEWVWVPSSDFEASLHISAEDVPGAAHRSGEWIVLRADRTTGPWTTIRYRDLPEGARWMRRPPPSQEHHVEGNVRWFAEPGGSHTFNIPTTADITTRKVRFTQPGEYRLWAESSDWAGGHIKSNALQIKITEE